MLEDGHRILFQGDSITDAGRDRVGEEPWALEGLGSGYVALATCRLLADYPTSQLTILNRGISGNRVCDLEARWQEDCLDLEPDVLSILIGVNDLWHKLQGRSRGSVDDYEQTYRALLQRTREHLPQVKLVIGEPFTLRCGAVDKRWFPEFDQRRAAAHRLAREFGAAWVPFQQVFDDAVAEGTDPTYWAYDGVHPTLAGHQRMADAWLDCIGARARSVRRRSLSPAG